MTDHLNLSGLMQELLGCRWGREIKTADDNQPCPEQAVRIIVIHHGEQEMSFKLCAAHHERVLGETTPHRPMPTFPDEAEMRGSGPYGF